MTTTDATTEPAPGPGPATRENRLQRLLASGSRVPTLLALTAAFWVLFTVAGDGFLGSFNLYSLSQTLAITTIIGLAQAALLVLGRINLAVGGIGVVVSATIGVLLGHGLPLGLVLVVGLLVGGIAGALVGAVELLTGLNSFVITLAFLSVYQGGVQLLTSGAHYPVTVSFMAALGADQLVIPYLSPMLAVAVLLVAGCWVFYFRTTPGWNARAVGANERAARASGISTWRSVITGYVLSGLLAAVAAVLVCAQLADASPTTGSDWLLTSFIGPLLAGVLLTGGVVSSWGVLAGSLFYTSIFSGFSVLDVPTYWLTLLQAAVLLLALLVGQLRGGHLRDLLHRGGRGSA